MVDGVQKIAKSLGLEGCYVLSLYYVAEIVSHISIDPIQEAYYGIKKQILRADCFVLDADAIFNNAINLGRGAWEVVKSGEGHPLPIGYQLKDGEHEILRFERTNPNGGDPLAHFVVGSGNGKTCAWDPWPDSLTVREGKLVSRRILRRKV